jgi:hypothetical protein
MYPYVCRHHHHHHLQGLSSSGRSVLKLEASLRIANNFTSACYQPVGKQPALDDPGFYSGFPSLRFPVMANESCLPFTSPWEGALTRCYPLGQWDLELAWGTVTSLCSWTVPCESSNLLILCVFVCVFL